MPKILHFREDCIGCGSCPVLAQQYFKMSNEDGKADLLNSQEKGETFVLKISDAEVDDAVGAAECLPVNIIRVVGDDGREIKTI